MKKKLGQREFFDPLEIKAEGEKISTINFNFSGYFKFRRSERGGSEVNFFFSFTLRKQQRRIFILIHISAYLMGSNHEIYFIFFHPLTDADCRVFLLIFLWDDCLMGKWRWKENCAGLWVMFEMKFGASLSDLTSANRD
jgi:hypothetical protein